MHHEHDNVQIHEHSHEQDHAHEHTHEHTHPHTHDGMEHTHSHSHGHSHDHVHPHTHEHLHEDGHTHEHTHDHHDHPHTHDHAHGEGHTPMEQLVALISYMESHNAAHTHELAELAEQLDRAGRHEEYHKVLDAVALYQKGNECLSAVLSSLKG